MDEKSIAVSEIRQWTICPRQLYFKISESEKESEPEEVSNKTVLREVLYELPEMIQMSIDKNQNRHFIDDLKLKRFIEKLANDIEFELSQIRPEEKTEENEVHDGKNEENNEENNDESNDWNSDENKDENKDRKINTKTNKKRLVSAEEIEKLTGNIHKTVESNGFILYESAADPFKTEPLIYSEKLNLYGRPSKILVYEEKLMPYIIRTSNAPANGIWENDRIQAAAYCMIAEKEFGRNQMSKYAAIDYLGEYRIFQVRENDKKKVFRAIRKIKDIKRGKMPAEKNIFLCQTCRYQEKCRPKMKTIFAKLFGKDRF